MTKMKKNGRKNEKNRKIEKENTKLKKSKQLREKIFL